MTETQSKPWNDSVVYNIVSGIDVNDIVDDYRWNCEGLDFTSVYCVTMIL